MKPSTRDALGFLAIVALLAAGIVLGNLLLYAYKSHAQPVAPQRRSYTTTCAADWCVRTENPSGQMCVVVQRAGGWRCKPVEVLP
jgi:hypothetical protein